MLFPRFIQSLLMLAMVLVGSSYAFAATPVIDLTRTAVISGVIRNGLGDVEEALEKWSTDKSGKPISLVINSPGGSVVSGFWFLNKMDAARGRGVKINCFVSDLAASMAFQILMHCDTRSVMSRALLLWHPVRTGTQEPITASLAKEIFETLHALDVVILRELNANMGGDESPSYVLHHFKRETLHVGESLAVALPSSFASYTTIPNIYEALSNPKLPRNAISFSIFGGFGGVGTSGIEYIAPDYVLEMFPGMGR